MTVDKRICAAYRSPRGVVAAFDFRGRRIAEHDGDDPASLIAALPPGALFQDKAEWFDLPMRRLPDEDPAENEESLMDDRQTSIVFGADR